MIPCYETLFFLNAALSLSAWSRPLTSDVKFRSTVSSRDSLETVFSLSWLGLEGYCFGLDLGLEYTVLVSFLVETFIKIVGHNAHCTFAIFSIVAIMKSYFC